MSLITDPLYIIHTSRIKFLRMDERGERIISFPPTVMSDDYVRLAAPIYPEMQYCYSPVYNNSYLSNNASYIDGSSRITSSPRTTKRNYRQRSKPTTQQVYNKAAFGNGRGKYPISTNNITSTSILDQNGGGEREPKSAATDSEDDDIEIDRQLLLSNSGKPIETTAMSSLAIKDNEVAAEEEEEEDEEEEEGEIATEDNILATANSENTSMINRSLSFRPVSSSSLHPSVDSAIDPSPRSSIDDHNMRTLQQQQEQSTTLASAAIEIVPASIDTTVDISSIHDVEEEENQVVEQDTTKEEMVKEEEELPAPLEYTKETITKQPQLLSALSALIAEKATKAKNPFSEYSFVSGKGESKSIKLCVYLPHSKDPYKPVMLVVRPDAITDDVIGYILYDYIEEKRQPELKDEEYDLAEWCLLIAEDDGEIEDDLPAIDRTRNIGRVSFDQFALCRATISQSKQNDLDRAKMGRPKVNLNQKNKEEENEVELLAAEDTATTTTTTAPTAIQSSLENAEIAANMLIENNLSPNNEDTLKEQERDASNVAVPIPSTKATLTKATMPMTPLKYFRIKLMTSEEVSATTAIPVYAEMFIGDVLELVSRKRKLDPNEYMLTIADSNVIVSNDTTVESMKGITDLTLVKKNTTLHIPTATSTHLWRSPIKRKKDEVNHPMYFTSTSSTKLVVGPSSTTNTNELSQYKKYSVSRKMPMFVSKRLYIMAIDGDYIHLMPPEHKGMFDSVKTTSFHASAVKSCKQSKKVPTNFKIIILKERDFKTYDLEAESPKEVSEICSRLRFLMQVTKGA